MLGLVFQKAFRGLSVATICALMESLNWGSDAPRRSKNMGFDANEPMTTIHLQMAGALRGT